MLARLIFFRCSSSLKGFLDLSEHALEKLSTRLDKLQDEGRNIEYSYKDGVLNVAINKNRIVINRQIPNQQIWYSSLQSGPQRFNYSQDRWVNSRGESIEEVLEKDLEEPKS